MEEAARRGRLALGGIIPKRSAILLSGDHSGPGADLFRAACEHGLVAAALRERLDRIVSPRRPIGGLKLKGAVWVSPDMRAEVTYRGVTTAGELQHASLKGIKEV